jgi:hypothetical protein
MQNISNWMEVRKSDVELSTEAVCQWFVAAGVAS